MSFFGCLAFRRLEERPPQGVHPLTEETDSVGEFEWVELFELAPKLAWNFKFHDVSNWNHLLVVILRYVSASARQHQRQWNLDRGLKKQKRLFGGGTITAVYFLLHLPRYRFHQRSGWHFPVVSVHRRWVDCDPDQFHSMTCHVVVTHKGRHSYLNFSSFFRHSLIELSATLYSRPAARLPLFFAKSMISSFSSIEYCCK